MNARVNVSVEQLSRETACSERAVRRAIRALAARGILSRIGPDRFLIHVAAVATMPKVRTSA
ncbi:MAG: HTH domain-containing protein [Candidatus Rokubacteria bacterium]|nr:HTH domain-containing protein [Candidatus Rokubacteria bacterium]